MPQFLAPELVSAIDRLCKPRRHSEIQAILEERFEFDDNKQPTGNSEWVQIGRQRRTITEPSLLRQIFDAVASSAGGTTGGATLAHERLIFNSAALTIWNGITSSIGAWRGLDFIAGTPPLTDSNLAEHAIREWALTVLRWGTPDEAEQKRRAEMINHWCSMIHAALHPKRELIQAGIACPECGALDYWSEGALYKHPLVIRYNTDAKDVVESATGHCRACGTEWPARALAWDIEHVNDNREAGAALTQRVADAMLVPLVNLPLE